MKAYTASSDERRTTAADNAQPASSATTSTFTAPPEELARSLAVMLPAMNVEDRVELLGGMRESAPPEVFEAVWGLAGSVLDSSSAGQLGSRLGI